MTTEVDTLNFDPSQEIRIALVMYGGVSLAVYMNGIAQEMLRLVRATAPSKPGGKTVALPNEKLSTVSIYRKLGQLAGRFEDDPEQWSAGDPIRTRFVIDVVSGTSAGGINGIYLSKALANGQSIDQLKQLWKDDGDVQVLLNDHKSVEPPLSLSNPPESLLNCKRMYQKLLKAFDGMDGSNRTVTRVSPYVEELDLFVTTTDFEGVILPLRLADALVYERRHKSVFHFEYIAEGVTSKSRSTNDFVADNNPFLAFAARCTSSFPVAFEPMRLSDIDEILEITDAYGDDKRFRSDSTAWEKFYESYLRPVPLPKALPIPFHKRSFVDGGYLDNKPFGHAIDALVKRHASLPVVRKLIYIEPAPEHPELEPRRVKRPDAIETGLAAATLPAYETIREDLLRVVDRNRLMERVKRLLDDIEEDIERTRQVSPGEKLPETAGEGFTTGEWVTLDLAELYKRKGPTYVGYNRLKVSAVTDDLSVMFARVYGLDEDSAEFQALRCLVAAWRDSTYAQYHEAGKPTQNQFLMDFDLAFRLRRLGFVLNKLDDLHRLKEAGQRILDYRRHGYWLNQDNYEQSKREFRNEVVRIKANLLVLYNQLRRVERQFLASKRFKLLQRISGNITITLEDLRSLIGTGETAPTPADDGRKTTCKEPVARPLSNERCLENAKAFLADPKNKAKVDQINETASKLRKYLYRVFTNKTAKRQLEILNTSQSAPTSAAVKAARDTAHHYFYRFDDYDIVQFPILFQTDAIGEGATIEVTRISPEDATCLDKEAAPLPKLAGTTLAHFGAFLEREWRKNDIMWGRLDAAERIIASVLTEPAQKAQRLELIDQAHHIILREELSDSQRTALYTQLQATGATDDALRLAKTLLLDEKEALKYYRENLDRSPNPKSTLRAAARATQIFGRMLDGIAKKRNIEGSRASVIIRIGQVFWGVVEVAVPRGIGQLVFKYWESLLYIFEILLIAGGYIAQSPDAQHAGWLLLILTVTIHLVVTLFSDYMRRTKTLKTALLSILAAVVIVLALIGIAEASRFKSDLLLWIANPPGLSNFIPTRSPHAWFVTALGAIGALLAFTGWWMQSHARSLDFVQARRKTSSGIGFPILALELPQTYDDIVLVAGDFCDPDRETLREIERTDNVFVFLYLLLLVGVAYLFGAPRQIWMASVVATFALAASICDWVENLKTLKLLEAPEPQDTGAKESLQPKVNSLRRVAIGKWTALSLSLLALAVLLLQRWNWTSSLGVLFEAAALTGLMGVKDNDLIQWASAIMGAGLLIISLLFLIRPALF